MMQHMCWTEDFYKALCQKSTEIWEPKDGNRSGLIYIIPMTTILFFCNIRIQI